MGKYKKCRKKVRKCSVINCVNSNICTGSLFHLPVDKSRCLQWLIEMGCPEVMSKGIKYIYNNLRICRLHFEDYMFTKRAFKLLRDAEPTIFINCGFNAKKLHTKPSVLLQPEQIFLPEFKDEEYVTVTHKNKDDFKKCTQIP